MSSAISEQEVKGVYNQWNIKVYEYEVVDGLKTIDCEDFQDLLTNISTRRATAIEKEITALAKNMENRNKELDYLSALLADMGKVAAKLNPDSSDSDQTITLSEGWSEGTLEAVKILSEGNYTYSNSLIGVRYLWATIGSTQSGWATQGSVTIKESLYEFMNEIGKSKVDGLNNDAQSDMTRLQSLVSKRDESYSTATSLLTSVSDTRSNLIKNF